MPAHPSPPRAAFDLLSRALRTRRAAQADFRSRAVLLVLAALVAAFVYWQVRIPLDGAMRSGGIAGAATTLSSALLALLALAAALAFERHGALLREQPGPEWLALPVAPVHVLEHLRVESRRAAAVAGVPMAAALAAAVGLLPPWVLLLAAAGALLGWLEATRAACTIAQRLAAPRERREASLPVATALLVPRAIRAAGRAHPPARWRHHSPSAALSALDRLATRRRGPSRTRLLLAIAFALLSLLAWWSGAPAMLRRAQSFAMFLGASAALGAWTIARAGDLPASFHRPLPLSPLDAWRARASVLALSLVLLALVITLVAAVRGAGGIAGIAALWPLPGLAIALLGLHHGLTLPSRPSAAEGLYVGWLAVMLAASWMIPLLGWILLVAALLHSLRRLPRGTHPEAVV